MVIVNNSKELSELKLNLAKIIGISITDIEFTYVSLSDK
jgi:hypothetical protein